MGRTLPTFKIALDMEEEDWKPFRNALDRSESKDFDDMFDIPRLYLTACSNSTQLVPLHLIIMSILFHHYKELTQLLSEVEQMEEAPPATTTVITNRSKKEEEEKKRTDDRRRRKRSIAITIKTILFLKFLTSINSHKRLSYRIAFKTHHDRCSDTLLVKRFSNANF